MDKSGSEAPIPEPRFRLLKSGFASFFDVRVLFVAMPKFPTQPAKLVDTNAINRLRLSDTSQ